MKTWRLLPVVTLVTVLTSLASIQAEVPLDTPGPGVNSMTLLTDETAQQQTPAPPPKLPYGVNDILTLSRAQIGETLILNYIKNSGTVYHLEPKQIIYLRDQGVSERVISTMLDQKKEVEAGARDSAAQSPAPAVNMVPYPVVYANPMPAPEPAPSTLHVIPFPSATRAYYGHYKPYTVRSAYSRWSPVYHGGYFGYGYGCGSSLVTIHAGFGGHSPRYRGR